MEEEQIKKTKKIATVLGICILMAVFYIAASLILKSFQAYADTVDSINSDILSNSSQTQSQTQTNQNFGCSTCNSR